jgi:uncharacterized RDD family membrane protein YckC
MSHAHLRTRRAHPHVTTAESRRRGSPGSLALLIVALCLAALAAVTLLALTSLGPQDLFIIVVALALALLAFGIAQES